SSKVLPLSTMPPDIIRRIIAADGGESVRELRMLCKSWRPLALKYIADLPPIEKMEMKLVGDRPQEDKQKELMIAMTVERTNLKHFEPFLPEVMAKTQRESITRLLFTVSLDEAAMAVLTRLFQRTTRIKHLKIEKVNYPTLESLRRTMRFLRIDEIEVAETPYFLKIANSLHGMCRLHRVGSINVLDKNDIDASDLTDFLTTISESVSVILLCFTRNPDLLGQRGYWKSLARGLMRDEGLRRMTIVCGGGIVCDIKEDFLVFSQLFDDSFFTQH
ncbi:hypothetical protein PMAYCL1PPCAC_13248, partial [Pristionchus mayeri]